MWRWVVVKLWWISSSYLNELTAAVVTYFELVSWCDLRQTCSGALTCCFIWLCQCLRVGSHSPGAKTVCQVIKGLPKGNDTSRPPVIYFICWNTRLHSSRWTWSPSWSWGLLLLNYILLVLYLSILSLYMFNSSSPITMFYINNGSNNCVMWKWSFIGTNPQRIIAELPRLWSRLHHRFDFLFHSSYLRRL